MSTPRYAAGPYGGLPDRREADGGSPTRRPARRADLHVVTGEVELAGVDRVTTPLLSFACQSEPNRTAPRLRLLPSLCRPRLNISYPGNGTQKTIEIENELAL